MRGLFSGLSGRDEVNTGKRGVPQPGVEAVLDAAEDGQDDLGDPGRLLTRPSNGRGFVLGDSCRHKKSNKCEKEKI